jgi:hypothetical protein
MTTNSRLAVVLAAAAMLAVPSHVFAKKRDASGKGTKASAADLPAVLWREPTDITDRNLFYGPGGEADQPHGRLTFVEEDLDGTNPKFVVRDQDGAKWKVKLGIEAQPETAASRLVWAAGYFANEDYFLPEIKVENLPARLHRGRQYVSADGTARDVRLKRYLKEEKKLGEWSWDDGPLTGTRQLNGLRVLMGLINNWDLKDENNSVYQEQLASGQSERIYMVSDLGASFGQPRVVWPTKKSRGNLKEYEHSKFIVRMQGNDIDLSCPGHPWFPLWFLAHSRYEMRLELQHIGRDIPREDARWMGQIMSRLSHAQIVDAFHAAGYSPQQTEEFARAVEERIAALNAL